MEIWDNFERYMKTIFGLLFVDTVYSDNLIYNISSANKRQRISLFIHETGKGWIMKIVLCCFGWWYRISTTQTHPLPLISLSEDVEPVSGKTTVSVTHGQCDARRTTLIYTAC